MLLGSLWRIAHTLNGSADNLGLTQIQSAAAKLEVDLGEGHADVLMLAREIEASLKTLEKRVAEIAKDDEGVSVEANFELAMQTLLELEPLLKVDDFKASQNFRENRPLMRASTDKMLMANLEARMNNYIFPSCSVDHLWN